MYYNNVIIRENFIELDLIGLGNFISLHIPFT